MPMPINKCAYKRFEEVNRGLKLNVYTPTDESVKCPITSIYIGQNDSDLVTNLLFLKTGSVTHYAYIRKLPALIHKVSKSHSQKVICDKCGDVCFHIDSLHSHQINQHPEMFTSLCARGA